jgi:pSer/pThr/pTyr-binding forkhead associated (FHA) protein/thioredoxin reductase/formate hydrogenlyase subunit 6/NADH:ubiquinone oxidoreductase subunit I
MIQLRFTSGSQQGRVAQIAGALATIGRSPSCDIVIDDGMASGIHATLEMVPAGYIVSDQQSTNGTMINGQRIWRALLRVGDEMVIGGTGLKVENSDGFAATIMPGVITQGAAPRIDAGKFQPVQQTVFAAGPAMAPAAAPMEAAVLEIMGPSGQGVRTLPIPQTGLVIGRLPECDVVLDDPLISRRHCSVAFGPAGAIVTDLESSGGTFLGETKLERGGQAKVTQGDIVKIGSHSLRVRAPRPGSIRQPVPQVPMPAREPTRHYLEVFEGAPPQKVELFTNQPVTVGRLPTSSIVLVDPYCSGQHCEIKLTPDGPVLTDIGSRNGTFVSPAGTELKLPFNTPKLMRPNEAFRIGAVKMRVLVIQPHAPETEHKQAIVAIPQPPPQEPLSRPTPSSKRLVMDAAAAMSVRSESELPAAQLPKSLRGAKLKFVAGPRAGTALEEVPLEKTHISIGRRDDNDITIDDRTVSTRHCIIVAEERGFVLYDHGSTNGTFVQGERVRGERVLVNGELVRIGVDAVAEFILEGNAKGTFFQQGASADMFEPKFLVRGAILKQGKLTIGRDAASDFFLDDPSIARSAAEIVFNKMKFTARSLAPKALAVNGRVTAEAELKTGDELAIGPFSIRVEVAGARMTLHEHANQSVVDGNASWARDEEDPSQAPVIAEAAVQSFASGGKANLMSSLPGVQYKTMFAADAAQLAELAPKREKKKGAPKWKATSDLLADRTRSGAMFVGLGCAAIVLGVVVAGGNAAFLDGALSQGHDSQHFQDEAKNHNLKGSCASCHQPGVAVQSERCQTCHVGFAPRRTQSMGKDHVQAGLRCSSCHVEHKGAMAGEALVARSSCSFSACHGPSNPPHRQYNPAAENTPFVKSVYTDPKKKELHFPTGTQEQMQLALHRIHVGVNRKCMACHVQADGVTPSAAATGSCFRCHDAPGVRAAMTSQAGGDDSQCLGCHMIHDKSMGDPTNVGVARAATPQKRGGPWTGGISGARTRKLAGGVLGSLFFLVGAFGWVYFGKRVRRVAKLALVPAEEEKKGAPAGSKAPGEAVDGKPAVKLQVNVNKEKCVGCACCVNACPTQVLEIVSHKSTVVKEENCTSCRACEQVCPSGALTMAAAGEPPRLIDLPDLDPYYQTNVQGLYLIGEAAGKSLVKNAANLGKVVVDHMVKAGGLKPGLAASKGADVEVVSIGTGPGGLSAALSAVSYGLTYACIDKARVYASTIQWCPKGKEFLAEPVDVKNISMLPVPDNGTKEQLIEIWDGLIAKHNIQLRLSEEVLDVKRDAATGVFTVTTSKGIIKCLKIVLSPGTRGNPRKLGVPGQEHEKVSYMLVDPAEHQNQHLLVVGGGDSAVECAMALAGQTGNVVTLSYRKDKFARIKPRNQERIEQHAKEGKIKIIFNSVPAEVRDKAIVLKINEEKQELQNDFVYCLLGADLPMVWLQQLGITYVKKPEGWNPGPTDQIVIQAPAIAA